MEKSVRWHRTDYLVNRLTTTGETVGNKITYNLYANFNPTINATADTGGTIEDSGITEVEYGTNKQYTVTADTGKDIASVTVDGNSVLAETNEMTHLPILLKM